MEIKKAIKTGGGILLSFGVGSVVKGIIESSVDMEESSKIKKFCVGLTCLALTGLITEQTIKYYEEKVDSAAKEIKKEVEKEEKPEEKKEV